MDWSGLVLGVGGLCLGGLTVVLSYRERTSGYRHALYERQVNAVTEVLERFADWHSAAQEYIFRQPGFPVLTDETRNGMRPGTAAEAQAFYLVFRRHAVVLPQHFLRSVSQYQAVFNALSAPAEVASQYEEGLVRSQDPSMNLVVAYQAVMEAGRHVVGTEPLSAQTMRLLGIQSGTERPSTGGAPTPPTT